MEPKNCVRCCEPMVILKDQTQVCVNCGEVIFGPPAKIPPTIRERVTAYKKWLSQRATVSFLIGTISIAYVSLVVLPASWWAQNNNRVPGALYANIDCPQPGTVASDFDHDHCAALYMTGDHSFDIRVAPGDCAVVVNGRCAIRASTGHVRVESVPADWWRIESEMLGQPNPWHAKVVPAIGREDIPRYEWPRPGFDSPAWCAEEIFYVYRDLPHYDSNPPWIAVPCRP